MVDGSQHGSQGQEISQVWESGWSSQDGISGAQYGGSGFGVLGKGRPYGFQVWGTGITHISRKRILELVEVLWENRDFQFSGSLGVGKNPSCEKEPLALGRKMEWELPEEGVQVPLRSSGLELRGLLLNGEVLVQPGRGEERSSTQDG